MFSLITSPLPVDSKKKTTNTKTDCEKQLKMTKFDVRR